MPLDYESYAAFGAGIGHGGVVVHDDTADLAQLARYAMEFCAKESCGKCTPCRIGSTRGVELIDRIRAEQRPRAAGRLLRDLCDTMVDASLCAMGGMTPFPVLSALDHYPRTSDWRRADDGQRHAEREDRRGCSTRSEIDHGTPQRESSDRSRCRSTASTVSVPQGTSIMRAAVAAGIKIPKLCATESLEPFGSCRLCLVEIEGRKGTRPRARPRSRPA